MSSTVPIYFEESWSILSSIGLINVLFGFTIVGITALSPLSLVPIVVSVNGAIANGLCYYAFYAVHGKTSTVIAAAVADICWLLQEAGMSFYSYLILSRVLKYRERLLFQSLFWSMMLFLLAIRLTILISRAHEIITDNTPKYQTLIDNLHIGYFSGIAVVECISAVFLLRKFAKAKRTSLQAASKSGLFSYLMKSTEIRLAILALIGISRAITYSFQRTAQSATDIGGEVDRFVYCLECMFPIMMFIDTLGSKIVVINHIHSSATPPSRQNGTGNAPLSRRGKVDDSDGDLGMYPISNIETRIDGHGEVSSSQERIVREESSCEGGDLENGNGRGSRGINKTVEFEFTVERGVRP